MQRPLATGLLICLLTIFMGCSDPNSPVPPVHLDADSVASAAVEQLDADGDQLLSEAELQAAPSIRLSKQFVDANRDGRVSGEEIGDRIEKWKQTQIGLMSFSCQVTLDGRPLADAEVRLDPEEFLQGQLAYAQGRTNKSGVATLQMFDDGGTARSEVGMVQPGFYKVRITHDRRRLPARYNTATGLGVEIAPDRPTSCIAAFSLRSN
ncbi:MAG: DUF4198 domain-containing protein [Pirellulales bacterium]|nr:DUF4198 domain-containing protein [Pirellulales bacterium]